MNETCDRCGPAVRASYRVDRIGELYLCTHCANQLWPALSAQGWTIWLIREHALAKYEGKLMNRAGGGSVLAAGAASMLPRTDQRRGNQRRAGNAAGARHLNPGKRGIVNVPGR